MSQDKLNQARELLQRQQYDEARSILETMPNDQTAQEWLAYLNSIQPAAPQEPATPPAASTPPPGQTPPVAQTPPPPASAPSGGQTPPPSGPPPAQQPPTPAGTSASVVPPPVPPRPKVDMPAPSELPLAFRPNFKLVAGGALGFLGFLAILLFFFVPLLDAANISYIDDYKEALEYEADNANRRDDRREAEQLLDEFEDVEEDLGDYDLSPWEIWLGHSYNDTRELDRDVSLDTDRYKELIDGELTEDEWGGFGQVRFIDRFLIFLPLGGLAVMVLAGLYAFNMLGALTVLRSVAAIFVVLFLFIFLWETMTTAQWRGFADDQITLAVEGEDYETDLSDRIALRIAKDDLLDIGEQYLTDVYNTFGFKFILGLSMLGAIGLALVTQTARAENPEAVTRLAEARKAQGGGLNIPSFSLPFGEQQGPPTQQGPPAQQQPYGQPPAGQPASGWAPPPSTAQPPPADFPAHMRPPVKLDEPTPPGEAPAEQKPEAEAKQVTESAAPVPTPEPDVPAEGKEEAAKAEDKPAEETEPDKKESAPSEKVEEKDSSEAATNEEGEEEDKAETDEAAKEDKDEEDDEDKKSPPPAE